MKELNYRKVKSSMIWRKPNKCYLKYLEADIYEVLQCLQATIKYSGQYTSTEHITIMSGLALKNYFFSWMSTPPVLYKNTLYSIFGTLIYVNSL